MVTEMSTAEMIVNAMMYMFFVAFSGGIGLVCAAGVGYKLYTRSQNKKGSGKRKQQGVV